MLIYIVAAIVYGKFKGYKVKPILKDYSLYPLAITEILYILLQINIFLGNYRFIGYASVFKATYLYTLIVPIIVHKLYRQGFIGSLLIMTGSMLNKFVMSQNGGKMPVYPTLSKYTGYFSEVPIGTIDQIHVLGNEATKYKILTDYIDIGYSILSVGDILIHAFIFIVVYYTIKESSNTDIKYPIQARRDGNKWEL
ncbi:DUF5317 family protein [Proteiniclasticum sp.]|uniref:DUF5317 family protein n=1 Tax=Proteiniclasticum sp. TaxID=2053595 RepID=UPI00289B7C64|nr:DUF5317 family protein [Proteiniclasticum sp.]